MLLIYEWLDGNNMAFYSRFWGGGAYKVSVQDGAGHQRIKGAPTQTLEDPRTHKLTVV